MTYPYPLTPLSIWKEQESIKTFRRYISNEERNIFNNAITFVQHGLSRQFLLESKIIF